MTTPTPPATAEEKPYHCPTCKSQGFLRSPMVDRCSFCDGRENGETLDPEEVFIWNLMKCGDDPCDEMMP